MSRGKKRKRGEKEKLRQGEREITLVREIESYYVWTLEREVKVTNGLGGPLDIFGQASAKHVLGTARRNCAVLCRARAVSCPVRPGSPTWAVPEPRYPGLPARLGPTELSRAWHIYSR